MYQSLKDSREMILDQLEQATEMTFRILKLMDLSGDENIEDDEKHIFCEYFI